jgi:hypothetical protein
MKQRPVITNYPVTIEFVFNLNESEVDDLDNFVLFYKKAFLDAIQTTISISKAERVKGQPVTKPNPYGFIPNDNKKYIRRSEEEWNEGFKSNSLTVYFKPFIQKK